VKRVLYIIDEIPLVAASTFNIDRPDEDFFRISGVDAAFTLIKEIDCCHAELPASGRSHKTDFVGWLHVISAQLSEEQFLPIRQRVQDFNECGFSMDRDRHEGYFGYPASVSRLGSP
jgi:hypothetical protein